MLPFSDSLASAAVGAAGERCPDGRKSKAGDRRKPSNTHAGLRLFAREVDTG